MQGMVLLDQLQVESDAHAVDEDDALIEKLLIGDLGVHELTKSGARADEFDCFRSAFCPWSQLDTCLSPQLRRTWPRFQTT